MKRIQITVDPGDADLPTTFEQVTGSNNRFARVQVVNWNLATTPAAFLLRIEGEYRRFETLLQSDPAINEFEILPLTEKQCYCFVSGPGTSDAWRLWEPFMNGSLMTIPPAEWNPDGSYTFTIIGSQADIQSAVETVSESVSVTVEAVGGTEVAEDSVLDRLTDRQRMAVETAINCGYYDVPRGATISDVARELDCATSTVAEHLHKAESAVLCELFN